MDCRRSRFLARLLLFPGAVLFAAGCTPIVQQEVLPPPPQVAAVVKKEADLPKIMPKASTCVAGAEFCRLEANAAKTTPAGRDEFRERARKGYQQALELDPKNQPAMHGLARLYVDLNDHDRAVAMYQKGLKLAPKDGSLSFELGMTHARFKEWELALVHLKVAFELEPENKQCGNMLGHCLARAGRYDEALTVFTKAVGEAKAHYNVARMLHHVQRDDLSRQHLAVALQADPQFAEARDLLVQLSGQPSNEEAPQPHRLPAENAPQGQ